MITSLSTFEIDDKNPLDPLQKGSLFVLFLNGRALENFSVMSRNYLLTRYVYLYAMVFHLFINFQNS
jgi:hypothetical protein